MTKPFAVIRACAALAVAAFLPAAALAEDPCADWVPQPKPQNASRDIVGADIDQITERGYIEFAVYADNPPYSWEEGGKPRGVDVDVARLVAESLGVEPRFNFVAAGENEETDLRNNLWKGPIVNGRVSNVMMRVPFDRAFKCRVEQVDFTGQYAAESLAIAYSKAAYPDEPPLPAYFRFDPVAVENDSLSDFYLTSFAHGQVAAGVRRFPTMTEAMAALARGEVKAVMGPLAQLEYGATEGIAIHQPPLPGLAKSSWTLGVGVHFRYKPLGYAVDDAIYAGLSDGRIDAIFASYGLTHQPPER